MFTIKLAGILLIVAVCSMWGVTKSFSVKRRYKKLLAFCEGLSLLYDYIDQGGCELDIAIKKSFYKCDFIMVKNGNTFCKDGDLTPHDKTAINEFMTLLGKSAKKADCNRIASFSLNIKNSLKEAENDAVQKGKLYQTFGVCIGLAIGILLI